MLTKEDQFCSHYLRDFQDRIVPVYLRVKQAVFVNPNGMINMSRKILKVKSSFERESMSGAAPIFRSMNHGTQLIVLVQETRRGNVSRENPMKTHSYAPARGLYRVLQT